MNKRPLMPGGLPAKPYVPPSAPAPPLPAGPPPPQAGYQQPQQDPAAAHAAAWAAYYQSQGLTATGQPQATGYNAPTPGPGANPASDPYANYGYGGHAAQAHLGGPGGSSQPRPPRQIQPSQTYRPPPQQQQQHNYPYPQQQQQQGYNSPTPYSAGPAQGYGGSGPGPQAGGYQQQPQQQQQWNQPGPSPQSQPYGGAGPGGPSYNGGGPGPQPYYPHGSGGAGPQQPYTPPHHGAQTPYRPPTAASSSPAPMSQNRPYQPQPGPARPPRPPPMNQGPTPPHHPPAKRPRFDGPGPGPGPAPPSGPSGSMPSRPSLPVRPGSLPTRPPSGPRQPLPAPPIMRPPIHLGTTSSGPPVFAPGGPRGGSAPMRGMGGDRGGGRGRGGLAHVPNAPRGPSHMRRQNQHDHRDRERDRERDRGSRRADPSPTKRDRKDVKKKDIVKTTMTDFRIVGIEIKELGWTWGMVGAHASEEDEPSKEEPATEASTVKGETTTEAPAEALSTDTPSNPQTNGDAASETVKTEETPLESVKTETDASEGQTATEVVKEEGTMTDEVEGKVGGKRKAQSPEADEGSSKKRSTYLLTHGKANEPPSHESNQNRFRIYFESPPEADRIPQALRRNPYKRWRRASSSVAPSRHGDEAKEEDTQETPKAASTKLPEVTEETETPSATTASVPAEAPQEASEQANAEEPAGHEPSSALMILTDLPTSAPDSDAVAALAVNVEHDDTVDAADTDVNAAAPPVNGHVSSPPTDETDELEPSSDAEPEVKVNQDNAGDSSAAEATDAIATEETVAPAEGDATTDAPLQAAADLPTATESVPTAAADPAGSDAPASTTDPTPSAPASTEAELSAALAQSAENTASAYKTRTRRRSSVSSTDSRETAHPFQPEVTPSMNRLSILYEGSQRRMCFDAEVVDKIRVFRAEGRIEVLFKAQQDDDKEAEVIGDGDTLLPQGYLLETYDQDEQRFAPVFREKLEEVYSGDDTIDSIPPLHRQLGCPTPPVEPLSINVYLNKKNPLSLPRWCRTDSADEWLQEQFGFNSSKGSSGGKGTSGWKGKLQVMDPDPPPTLSDILESWATSSSVGTSAKRTEFTSSLLSEPYDLLEILLRLARGDRNPSFSSSSSSSSTTASSGGLAAAIRADSPYASHQTHVSLAILAMYRLTTDYAAKAGEKSEVVNEKIGDIIKSLPSGMISRSLDGMFREWDGKGRDRK